ncbi:MAG TPA: hypothetical protein PKY59_22130 [Pyrinomonadaceae bacterium]|nr:hypothetical protein [Pyrinomonadaceae bacterium]
MKIRFYLLILTFVLSSLTFNLKAQDQNYNVKITSFGIKTDRQRITSNQGEFYLYGTRENGTGFARSATNGNFYAPITGCVPACRKGSIINGTFFGGTWRTAGDGINPSEYAVLGDLQVTAPQVLIPVQFPFNKLFTVTVPVQVTGPIVVRDARPGTYRIIYTDPDVNLSGYMRAQFKKSSWAASVEWVSAEVIVSENNTQAKEIETPFIQELKAPKEIF